MDEAVNTVALIALLLGSAAAGAQALPDPTQPPALLLAPQAKDAVPAGPVLPQLQSILIGRASDGRRVAVIDGTTVRLGERFKGALLASVSETEVVLMRGTEKQVLKLYPQAELKAAPAQR